MHPVTVSQRRKLDANHWLRVAESCIQPLIAESHVGPDNTIEEHVAEAVRGAPALDQTDIVLETPYIDALALWEAAVPE